MNRTSPQLKTIHVFNEVEMFHDWILTLIVTEPYTYYNRIDVIMLNLSSNILVGC